VTDAPGSPPDPDDALDFVDGVLEVVSSIPPGRVMSYGDIATALGSRAPRQVGLVMARYGSDVPWWRVVRASGHPPRAHERQARPHYLAEGTPLVGLDDDYHVNLKKARHRF
jgi:alkylated DNA nucleotide flippase Atl1